MNSLIHPCRGLALAIFSCGSLAWAQQPAIVSLDSAGGQGNDVSWSPSVSTDGRFVAFASAATNLVPNDTNNQADIFVRDNLLATTTRVSISSTGQQANGHSNNPVISASGNRVVFVSTATNLASFVQVSNQPNHVFVHDLQTGVTELASIDVQGNTPNVNPTTTVMSGDGNSVLFLVDLSVVGSQLGPYYVRNLQTQTTTLLVTTDPSLFSNPRYSEGQFLGDGRWVAFTRLQPMVGGPTARVLIIDRDSDQNGILDEPGTITRKTIEPSQGAPFVRLISSSRNGRFLSYLAAAFGVPGSALWLHDRDPDGDGVFDQPSSVPDAHITDDFVTDSGAHRVQQVSNDGRHVLYLDQRMVDGGEGNAAYVRDMQTGETFIQGQSVASGQPASIYVTPTISADGLSIVASTRSKLVAGDVNVQYDVYVIPHGETIFCEPPVHYGLATPNSVYAFGASIELAGFTQVSADDFTLVAEYVPNSTGQFFYGPQQVSTPFGDGTRLVGAGQSGLIRLPIVHAAGNIATYQLHLSLPPASAGPGQITPGSTWNFQYVFRDPTSGTFGFNTSDALSVTFCP